MHQFFWPRQSCQHLPDPLVGTFSGSALTVPLKTPLPQHLGRLVLDTSLVLSNLTVHTAAAVSFKEVLNRWSNSLELPRMILFADRGNHSCLLYKDVVVVELELIDVA